MYEDAGCDSPCGGEPLMCGTCPDFGSRAGESMDSLAGNVRCRRCGTWNDPAILTHGFCDSCVDEIAFGDDRED